MLALLLLGLGVAHGGAVLDPPDAVDGARPRAAAPRPGWSCRCRRGRPGPRCGSCRSGRSSSERVPPGRRAWPARSSTRHADRGACRPQDRHAADGWRGTASGPGSRYRQAMFDGRFRAPIEKARASPSATACAAPASPPTTSPLSGWSWRWPRPSPSASASCAVGLLLLVLAALPDLLDGAAGQGLGQRQPAGRLLRLGGRPGHRHAAARRRGLVPRRRGHGRPRRAAADGRPGRSRCSSPTSGPRPSRSGFDAKGGLMERAERIILLCLGLLFASLLVPILWVMLVLTRGHRGAAVREGVAPGQRRSGRHGAPGRPPAAPHRPPLGPHPPLGRAATQQPQLLTLRRHAAHA